MRRPFAERDTVATELMDSPDADAVTLARTYDRFAMVNAVVSGTRAVYRRWVQPRLRHGVDDVKLVDIGTGGADVPRRMLRWAASEPTTLSVLGIDPEPRAIAFAHRVPTPALEVRQASSAELRQTGERFDIVLSNHVLHHLSDDEVVTLLADSEALLRAGGAAVHSDLVRSPVAYTLFAAATWPVQWTVLRNTFIRPDGLTSIRRSRTVSELRRLVPGRWAVRRRWFHVEVTCVRVA